MDNIKSNKESKLEVEVDEEALIEASQENAFEDNVTDHFSPPSEGSSIPSENIERDYDFGSAGSRRESDGESWETVSEELREEEAAALEQERLSNDLLMSKSMNYGQRLLARNMNESKPLPENVTQVVTNDGAYIYIVGTCLLYTSPSPRDATLSRMPSSA